MNNHLILTALVDNRIHNLKGLVEVTKNCIKSDIMVDYNTSILEEMIKELEILIKQRQVIFDNYLIFDVKI